MIKFVNFRASDIEPNPNEVLYWVDLNEDPTGGSIKYWNKKGYWLTIRVLEGTLNEFEERITKWVTEELQEQTEWVEDLVHQFDGRIAIVEGDILNLYTVKLDKLIPGYGIEITEDNTINCTVDLSLYRVVAELPTEDIDESKIYIVFDPDGTGTNTHEEYVYVDGKWELLGKYADYASITELQQEIADRKAADQQLQLNIDAEVSRATAKETELNEAITNEISRATLKESEIETSLNLFKSTKGQNSGLASLDENGRVPSAQLPSYVDDVVEADALTAFPETGESGKIYIAKDTNKTYRWSGTDYTEISASLALGETSSTAYAGDKGKDNRDALLSLPSRIITSHSIYEQTPTNLITKINYVKRSSSGSGLTYGNEQTSEAYEIPAATTTTAGVMTAADKAKLDAVELNVIDATLEAKDYADDLVSNIKVGGRNLLLNSSLEVGTDWSMWIPSGTGVFTTFNGIKCYKREGAGVGGLYTVSNSINIPEYGTVISSLDVYATAPCIIGLGVEKQDNIDIQVSEINKWVRISKKQELKGFGAYTIYVNISDNDTVYIKNVKCELGNVATDWSPAPEDLELTFTDGTDGSFTVTKGTGEELKVNIGKPATAGTADTATDCVKKTGDTMTGDLNLTNGNNVTFNQNTEANDCGDLIWYTPSKTQRARIFTPAKVGTSSGLHICGSSDPYKNGVLFLDTDILKFLNKNIWWEGNLSPVTTNTELTITGRKIFLFTDAPTCYVLKNSSDNSSYLRYEDRNGLLGYLGILSTTGEPFFQKDIIELVYKIWHEGNDGSGSGLDADTVDGIHASSFALTTSKLANPYALTFTGAVTGTYDGSAAKTVNIPTASTRASLGIDTDDAVVFAKVTASGGFWKESDKRLKSNIKPLEHTIEQITSIPTVEFDMNDKHQIGTIAQDIETVVPEVVSESDGIKKVEYSMMGVLAIEGIKLLKQEIEDLKKEIELLKNK